MKEVEIKHLAPYLPHKLETDKGLLKSLEGDYCGCSRAMAHERYICAAVKPLMYPLSDLKDDMVKILKEEYNEDYYYNKFREEKNELVLNDKQGSAFYWTLTPQDIENRWHWNLVNILIKRHYDVFGLIDKGLAIDKKTYVPPGVQNPCPKCQAELISKHSGVKCSKCEYWFCA